MMKKQLVITLMLVFLVSIASTAFAAANPFGDVPAKHWAYSAVSKLAKDGIIDTNENTFRGDKNITRYEMAQLVARAVWNTQKATAEDRALINKLATEFAAELNNLGVRVDALEKKSEQAHLFGVLHVSDQAWNNSGDFSKSGNLPQIGVDLFFTYKVNDAWKVVLEDEAVRNMRQGSYGGAPGGTAGGAVQGLVVGNQHMDQMFAVGKVGETTVTVGKWDYNPAYGAVLNMSDRAVNGVQAAFGNKLVTKLTYGYIGENGTAAPLNSNIISSDANNRYGAVEINLPLSKTANFKAAYHDITNGDTNVTTKIAEAGVDKMLTKDLQLWATYAQSNFDTQNREYFAGLNYKRADFNVPGSYRLSARYIDCEAYASVGPINDWWVDTLDCGFRGPQVNLQYVLDKNIDFQVWASSLSATDGTTGKLRTVKAEVDYFF
ncbi:MAG: S-layer y domain protein [Firmicutes bacterium]|nr:S-layer y domain protein [Bacillota bacterium]